MSTAFQPVREDGRPYWQVIYDDLVARIDRGDLKVGDIVKHDELTRLLDGLPHYQPTAKAAQHLREHHRRDLLTVRGVGYKLVAGMDQAGRAKSLHRKSHRTLVKASRVVDTVDHSLLSPAESTVVTQMAKGMAVLAGFVKMTAVKVAEHEQEISLLKSHKMESTARQTATESEVAELRRRLDELDLLEKPED